MEICSKIDLLKFSGELRASPLYINCNNNYIDIFSFSKNFRIVIPDELEERMKLFGQLDAIFYDRKEEVIFWDLKSWCSHVYSINNREIEDLPNNIINLSFLEDWHGVLKESPISLDEALVRKNAIYINNNLDLFEKINKDIYLPLAAYVIPYLENIGINDRNRKKFLKASYSLHGHINGRLICTADENTFNPHSLDNNIKQYLFPPISDEPCFACFDYSNMEVAVLQWLSNDVRLKEILSLGGDVYANIWSLLLDRKNKEGDTERCKVTFLPVMFGMREQRLANNLNIEEDLAAYLIRRIEKLFPQASSWIAEQQRNEQNGLYCDFFGRRRHFDEKYKIRNFSVASPASLICMKKLVDVYFGLKIGKGVKLAFSVHDGYWFYCKNIVDLSLAKNILEDMSSFSGLDLHVKGKFGLNLHDMKNISC